MPKRYQLKPKFDPKHNKWRLNLPAQISASGKRERHLFKEHSEALAEANKIRRVFHDFGRSIKMLPANRLIESIECWDKLDETFGEAPSGSLRRIVLRECKAIKDRDKSITLGALFDSYVDKLKRMHRAENYVKGYHYLRGYMDFWLEAKVSDLTAGNIRFSLGKLPSGHFNSNLRLLRAVLGHGVKLGYLKSNPTLNLEFVHRERVEVKPLPNAIVRGMLNDAATCSKRLEMLPYLALAYGTGCREGELSKLIWSDVFLEEKRLLIRASVSKTRNSRYVSILGCFPEWIRLYLDKVPNKPTPDERIMRSFTLSKIRDARAANYKAAGGIGNEPQNSKRRTCASCHRAFYENDPMLSLQLGHTNIKQSQEYAGAATKQQATEYFEIRPSA